MKYVLDSSAIALILKRLGGKSIDALEESVTIGLAAYELGNILWKEYTLKGIISLEEAVKKAEQMAKVLEVIKLENIESAEEFKEVMRIATELKLTFYDASYLQVAKRMKIPLVTEDKELLEKAEHVNVKAINVNEFLETFRLKKYSLK